MWLLVYITAVQGDRLCLTFSFFSVSHSKQLNHVCVSHRIYSNNDFICVFIVFVTLSNLPANEKKDCGMKEVIAKIVHLKNNYWLAWEFNAW